MPRDFRIVDGLASRMALSEGTYNNGESVVLKDEYQQLYGCADELHGFAHEKPTLLRFDDSSGKDSKGFVFVLGQSPDDGTTINCEECSRALAMNILNGQVIRVVFECPDCGAHTGVHLSHT